MTSKKRTTDANPAAGRAVRKIAHEIIADARGILSDTSRSDAGVIHEFRRSMKRWRALLRLIEPALGKQAKRLRREARDLARELSGPRDAQSALDAMRDIARHSSSDLASTRSFKMAVDCLISHRKKLETSHLNARRRARLLRALDRAAASVERWPLTAITLDAILDRLSDMYRRARRARPHDWSAANPDTLHRLRQRVVDYRYQMELLGPLWPRKGRTLIREAQELRSRLGKHQDLVMLLRLTQPAQPLARWRARLLPAVARRRAKHMVSSKRIASRLFASSPKTFRRHCRALWIAGGGKMPSR